jgi:peptide deformylase
MPRKIVHYPHPALRHKSQPVTTIDKELHLHIGEMMELMYQAKGLGLAAPQVALPFQLLVMNITGDPNQPECEEVFPGLYQDVRRAQTIKVRAYNLKGELVEKVISDLEARAWQHEIDHLNGVLFIDMMGPIARFAARTSVKKFEKSYREAQAKGEIPPDVEIEKLLEAIESH